MEGLADKGAIASNNVTAIANYDSLQYRLAQTEHEAELRQAMRENAIPGWITLSYEREPNYFYASSIEGDSHNTVIGLDTNNGRIMGIGSRSVQKRFVNGKPMNIGYLGQLRVSPDYRNKLRALKYGFDFCRRYIHSDGVSPYYLTSIISDNQRAKRLLTSDVPGYPRYRFLDNIYTLAIPTRRPRVAALETGVSIEAANENDIDGIVACLNRNNQRFQFASYWTKQDILSNSRCRGLSMGDFIIARKNGNISACLALWNQSEFKQVVVRGYTKPIKHARPILNAFSRLLGYPTLPKIDQAMKQVFVSHLALDQDSESLLIPLLRFALGRAKLAGQELVLLGLSQHSPFLAKLRRNFKHISYGSSIYLVYWDDTLPDIEQLKQTCLHLDIAVL